MCAHILRSHITHHTPHAPFTCRDVEALLGDEGAGGAGSGAVEVEEDDWGLAEISDKRSVVG